MLAGSLFFLTSLPPLALASNADDSSANLRLIMLGVGMIAAAAVLVAAVVLVARGRRHPQLQVLAGALVLWGVAAAGSSLWYASAQANWSKQRLVRIESGYGADATTIDADAPQAPLLLWGGLAGGYLLLVAWSLLAKPAVPQADQPGRA